jgi:anti-sigma B factor antagonist
VDLTAVAQADGAVVLQPSGRIDLLSAGELRQRLIDTIAAGQRRLVVDLEAVPFIDSSGLGALIGGLKAARLAGGDLRIARPNAQVRTVLSLTTLDRVLRPYETVAAAVSGFADANGN